MIRGLYEHSTDLAYSPFEKEDLLEIARALDFNHINIVTTATLTPERTLFHSCLNGVQSYVRLENFGEAERGAEIAELSQKIYDDVLGEFRKALNDSHVEIQQKRRELHAFIDAIDASQSGKAWDEAAFLETWPPNEQPYRWQSKAIETYQTVKNNIESGAYQPAKGWDARRITEYWGERNLEYKHYRWIGRKFVEHYIKATFPDRLLTKHPSESREMGYIFGPMGAGKSQLTAEYLWALPEEERHDIILHDADYLKAALAQTAIKEGVIERTTGAEIQNESSIALYEGARKRHFLASHRQHAPNVVLNSIRANTLELEEGLVGGGSVKASLISMSPEDAWRSVRKRGETLRRLPAQEDVKWSAVASVDSLLNITAIGQSPITTKIYDRRFGEAPEWVATLDSRTHCATITHAKRFADVLCRSSGGLSAFVKAMQDHGWRLNFMSKDKADEQPIASLSADGVWEQAESLPLSHEVKAFQELATHTRVGERIMPAPVKTTGQLK